MNQQDGKGVPLVEEALDNARRVLDEKNPYIADLSSLLAGLCLDLNQLEKGEAMARRAVELRRQTLDEGNAKTIGSIGILATIHRVPSASMRRCEKACPEAGGRRGFERVAA